MDATQTQASERVTKISCECKGGFWEGCWKVLVFGWKYVLGGVFTQTLLGSILVNGWVYRMSQREVLKTWWKQAEKEGSTQTFMQFVHGDRETLPHRVVPNWFFEQNTSFKAAVGTPGLIQKLRGLGRKLFQSLWFNLKLGVQQIFNTWVLTLPGCVMWLWSWYDGWNNSFNKGYENAIVGPATGFLGIFMFIGAMYYVPLAQMRQASTGNWRSFYEFKLVWQLIRKRWLACFGLAVLYAVCSLPLMIMKTVPAFFGQMNEKWIDASATEVVAASQMYYFACGLAVFGLFVLLRIVAARVYAGAMLSSVRSGRIPEDALGENEWRALHRLDLLEVAHSARRHPVVEAITWLGSRFGRVATGFAMFLVWFGFASQIYVSEFVMKTDLGKGWLNQPLVQLPYFNYTPRVLRGEAARLKADAKSAQNSESSPNP